MKFCHSEESSKEAELLISLSRKRVPVLHSHQQRKFQVSSYNKIPKGGKVLEERIVVAAEVRHRVLQKGVH